MPPVERKSSESAEKWTNAASLFDESRISAVRILGVALKGAGRAGDSLLDRREGYLEGRQEGEQAGTDTSGFRAGTGESSQAARPTSKRKASE